MSFPGYRSALSSFTFKALLLCLSLLGAVLLITGGESFSGASDEVVRIPGASASRVHIDPRTGELRQTPFDSIDISLRMTPSMQNSVSTSTVGLVVEDGAGGGKMVRLQGRFRHLSAVAARDDSVGTVRCFDGSASASGEVK
jgi:hypothetical protein